jgi:hypothetical protein
MCHQAASWLQNSCIMLNSTIIYLLVITLPDGNSEPPSKDDPRLRILEYILPLINGQVLGPKKTLVHRYLLVLYLAQTPVFRLTGQNFDDNIYFTIFGLWTIAKTSLSNPIKFDKTRVAIKVYRKVQKEELVVLRKSSGDDYVTLTDKGKAICGDMLPDLITLAWIHRNKPGKFDDYQPEDKDNYFGTRKGVKHHPFGSSDLQILLDELVEKTTQINRSLGDEISTLEESDDD